MAGEKIIGVIKQMNRSNRNDLMNLIYGKVTSINPLKIFIESKFEVDSSLLILSKLCVSKTIDIQLPSYTVDINKTTDIVENKTVLTDVTINLVNNPIVKKITLWEGLKVGDKVRLLRCSNGQKYYVLDKEGGL